VGELWKLQLQLEELVNALEQVTEDKENLASPPKSPAILEVATELEERLREVQTLANEQLFAVAQQAPAVVPQRETLQIILGTCTEALEALKEVQNYVQQYRSQSQVKKGWSRLLGTSSQLDYAAESAKTLLRLARKVASQVGRLEVLMK
jgi:hypothetical protein